MKLDRVIVLAANPKVEGYPGDFEGYDCRSGNVQLHIDFLHARAQQKSLVYWDIPISAGSLEELLNYKIDRGYIYCTRESPEGLRMGRGIHYAIDIHSISRRLTDYPDVNGLPEWRAKYSKKSLSQLCWIGITAIRAIPPVDFSGFRSPKTGQRFGLDFVYSWSVLLEET